MNAVEIYEKASYDVEHSKITLGEFEERIKPLYDVEPVRHGRWEKSYLEEYCGTDENHKAVFRNIPCVKCDKCGEKRRSEEKFCPNCGAKMDGEEQEDGN